MIREAVLKHLRVVSRKQTLAWQKRHADAPQKLFVSDVGQCVRKAYLRINGYKETHPFGDYVREVMRAGIVWEKETTRAIRLLGGFEEQVSVGNDIWSGRIDFLSDIFVIEHKATNPVNFRYGKRLPYEHHCLQVLAYDVLLEEAHIPILYYRGWAGWAELDVVQDLDGIQWFGRINGREKSGLIETNVRDEMAKFEEWWGKDELPPKYETPTTEHFACTRKVKTDRIPNCPYYGVCWGEE